MESAVEKLPVEIGNDDGYYLRIKARDSGKKWCIRYIRKVSKKDNPIPGWKYRTEIQCWGNTLENCAQRMLKRLQEFNYI